MGILDFLFGGGDNGDDESPKNEAENWAKFDYIVKGDDTSFTREDAHPDNVLKSLKDDNKDNKK